MDAALKSSQALHPSKASPEAPQPVHPSVVSVPYGTINITIQQRQEERPTADDVAHAADEAPASSQPVDHSSTIDPALSRHPPAPPEALGAEGEPIIIRNMEVPAMIVAGAIKPATEGKQQELLGPDHEGGAVVSHTQAIQQPGDSSSSVANLAQPSASASPLAAEAGALSKPFNSPASIVQNVTSASTPPPSSASAGGRLLHKTSRENTEGVHREHAGGRYPRSITVDSRGMHFEDEDGEEVGWGKRVVSR